MHSLLGRLMTIYQKKKKLIGKLNSHPSPKQAVFELLFASSIWGFGFIGTRWGLEFADAFWLNTIRFYLAFLFALPIILAVPQLRRSFNRQQFFLAAWPGLFLGSALILQTYGLHFTTVTKSGFITVLYIVFVPFLERLVLKTRIKFQHFIFVLIALVGSALICDLETSSWNLGDLLTLFCSICAASQIVSLEKHSTKIASAFVFNVFQTFWAGVLPLILAILFEAPPRFPISERAALSILSLSLASTLLAFLIQVRSQKVLNSSTVSMLFLLESPFAALFAYLLLGEVLSVPQWLGALLILGGALGSVYSDGVKFKSNPHGDD